MIKYFQPVRSSYAAAEAVQQRFSRALLDFKKDPRGEAPPMALLAYEMDPTYTLGRREKGAGVNLSVSRPCEIVETLRGGFTTFHGPGQLVLYPVLDLQWLGIRVRDYMCYLERSIIAVLKLYGIVGEQRFGAGLNGVWIGGTPQKIASIGVHVRRNVTSHGLALNVDLDPYWFAQIVACNLPMAQMVSMSDFCEPPDLHVVSDQLAQELTRQLTGHLLKPQ